LLFVLFGLEFCAFPPAIHCLIMLEF